MSTRCAHFNFKRCPTLPDAISLQGAVSLGQWSTYSAALHQWGFRANTRNEAGQRPQASTFEGSDSEFRPDILSLSIPPLAKTLELTLDTMRACYADLVTDSSSEQL